MFYKQALVFSVIIFLAVIFSYTVGQYKDKLEAIVLKAAAIGSEQGNAIKFVFTEDLDPR